MEQYQKKLYIRPSLVILNVSLEYGIAVGSGIPGPGYVTGGTESTGDGRFYPGVEEWDTQLPGGSDRGDL
jgi:hypothetical protein